MKKSLWQEAASLFGRKSVKEAKKPRSKNRASGAWTKSPKDQFRYGYPPWQNPRAIRSSEWDDSSVFGSSLSGRQLEVLFLMAEGLTNHQISQVLYVSEETIKSHVRQVLAKLGARNRAHSIAIGFRTGWLTTNSSDQLNDLLARSRRILDIE